MQTYYSYVFCCCFFCHYDCSLLKILPSFPELVCSAVLIVNNIKKKIRATGAQGSVHSFFDIILKTETRKRHHFRFFKTTKKQEIALIFRFYIHG